MYPDGPAADLHIAIHVTALTKYHLSEFIPPELAPLTQLPGSQKDRRGHAGPTQDGFCMGEIIDIAIVERQANRLAWQSSTFQTCDEFVHAEW